MENRLRISGIGWTVQGWKSSWPFELILSLDWSKYVQGLVSVLMIVLIWREKVAKKKNVLLEGDIKLIFSKTRVK